MSKVSVCQTMFGKEKEELGSRIVTIDYTNWRGERGVRKIIPGTIYYNTIGNEFHPEPQYLLTAIDVEKDAVREFALKDIHSWISVTETD